MKDLKVWMRVGDQGDYHAFDCPEEAASDMAELLVAGCVYTVERQQSKWLIGVNVTGSGYVDENGVSLYWGDDDAQFAAELSELDLDAFRYTLEAELGC